MEGVSAGFGGPFHADLANGKRQDWLDYALGCLQALGKAETAAPAVRLAAVTDVPIGAGVSSSAAFEVAMLKAMRAALDLPIDDIPVATTSR